MQPAELDQPGVGDNRVLDEWRIPFGDWYDQAIDWIDNDLDGVLKVIQWPFDQLISFVNDTVLLGVPWFVVILAFFIIGTLAQNVRVGTWSALALTVCGLMGTEYWDETAKTIGFILVAVFLCVLIGVPIGIACGRVDGIWRTVRPILDAMQVVHSFVYMLPFIYFFGIGETSATMVTMVFALPPLIRLTNLGIRQVPEDVVEASRAFGQNELNILRDVQLPLARPAIMTGINQTLLLSISMLGIAAIMGAGGLAKFMFQALNSQSPALSGSAGLSFFLVAVVLDRITQRDGAPSSGTIARLKAAWANTKTPENLLADGSVETPKREAAPAVIFAEVGAKERAGILVAMTGAVVALVSVFLTWNTNGGWLSSWSRRIDEVGSGVYTARNGKPIKTADGADAVIDLAGQGFNGLAASGGSWFGYFVVFCAVIAVLAGLLVMRSPGRTSRWLNADGTMILSLAITVAMLAYLVSSASPAAVGERGIGPIVALVGGLIMTAGSAMWMVSAKHSPTRPLPTSIQLGPLIGTGVAVLMLYGAGYSGWTFDTRSDGAITADVQEKMDALRDESRDPETSSARVTAIATEIAVLKASANENLKLVTSGFKSGTSRIAIVPFILSIVAFLASFASVGMGVRSVRHRWLAGTLCMGIGAGIMGIAVGWIGTLARATDPNIVSGVGVLITLIAGAAIGNAGLATVSMFVRDRVYEDIATFSDEGAVR